MTSPITTAVLAVAAGLVTISAGAETGRPSCAQEQRIDESTPSLQAESPDDQPGSYARYLMLNGVRREAAIAAARTIDHPGLASKALIVAPTDSGASLAAGPQSH